MIEASTVNKDSLRVCVMPAIRRAGGEVLGAGKEGNSKIGNSGASGKPVPKRCAAGTYDIFTRRVNGSYS